MFISSEGEIELGLLQCSQDECSTSERGKIEEEFFCAVEGIVFVLLIVHLFIFHPLKVVTELYVSQLYLMRALER